MIYNAEPLPLGGDTVAQPIAPRVQTSTWHCDGQAGRVGLVVQIFCMVDESRGDERLTKMSAAEGAAVAVGAFGTALNDPSRHDQQLVVMQYIHNGHDRAASTISFDCGRSCQGAALHCLRAQYREIECNSPKADELHCSIISSTITRHDDGHTGITRIKVFVDTVQAFSLIQTVRGQQSG